MPIKHRRTKRKTQRGGSAYASACSSDPSLGKYMASHCNEANIHNTNPEGSTIALAQGAGFLPGLRGGAMPPMTFNSYTDAVKGYLGVKSQSGGSYYSINPEEMIGGLARVDKGDSCCQGAILGGKFVQGSGSAATCGNQMGGARKKSKKSSKGKKKASKKTKKRNTVTMRGGGSMPASFPDVFNTAPGNFSPDAKDKDFSCKQPYWGAGCR